jgi:hypothetical protein
MKKNCVSSFIEKIVINPESFKYISRKSFKKTIPMSLLNSMSQLSGINYAKAPALLTTNPYKGKG